MHLETCKAFSLLGAQSKGVGGAEAGELSHTCPEHLLYWPPKDAWTGLTLPGSWWGGMGGPCDKTAKVHQETPSLPLHGVRTQVTLFIEELHFPEAPGMCIQV